VPEHIGTFRKLREVANFDPFENLVYVGIGKPEPNPDDYDLISYCAGMYARERVQREGIHRFIQFVNQQALRNSSRFVKQFADFLPPDGCFVSPKELRERFRESVSKQLQREKNATNTAIPSPRKFDHKAEAGFRRREPGSGKDHRCNSSPIRGAPAAMGNYDSGSLAICTAFPKAKTHFNSAIRI
jgi:hypothetical protein